MYKNLNMGALGHSVSFDVTCALATKYGFAGVDLDMGYLSTQVKATSVQATKDWFASTGLRVGGLGLSAAWRDWDTDATFDASLAGFVAETKLAAEFGCTRCFTWVMPRSDTLNFYQHFDLVYPRLKHVCHVLRDHGMTLGLEFVGPNTMRTGQKFDFVHTMDGMRAFAAALGVETKNTGLLLDAWHWWTAHGTLTELAHLHNDEIVYVHLNDAPHAAPVDEQLDNQREQVGYTGVLPVQDFLRTLKQLGYNGPLTVEPFSARVKALSPEAAAAETSAALDKVLAGV